MDEDVGGLVRPGSDTSATAARSTCAVDRLEAIEVGLLERRRPHDDSSAPASAMVATARDCWATPGTSSAGRAHQARRVDSADSKAAADSSSFATADVGVLVGDPVEAVDRRVHRLVDVRPRPERRDRADGGTDERQHHGHARRPTPSPAAPSVGAPLSPLRRIGSSTTAAASPEAPVTRGHDRWANGARQPAAASGLEARLPTRDR